MGDVYRTWGRHTVRKELARPNTGLIKTVRISGNESSEHLSDSENGYFRGSIHEHGLYGNSFTQMDVVRPYIVVVQNGNDHASNYVLFGAYQNRTSASFGNPSGITVSYGMSGYTYHQLLAETESQPFILGRIRIDTMDGNSGNLTSPLTVNTNDIDGTISSTLLTPHVPLNQFITHVVEMECDVKVDAYTSIEGYLNANSGVRFTLFPSARVRFDRFALIERRRREEKEYEELRYLLILTID